MTTALSLLMIFATVVYAVWRVLRNTPAPTLRVLSAFGVVWVSAVALVSCLGACTSVTYRVGDAEVNYTNGVFEKSFSTLSVSIDPDTGVRTITVEGWKSEAAQIAEGVARGVAEGAAKGATP